MLYAFFWAIPRRLKFVCRRLRNFSNLVHSTHTYLPMKMEQSVPKRRHVHFRRRRITQKKAYNVVFLRNSPLECKTSMLSETSCTGHSMTQRHVPEERRSQLQRCASLKSGTFCRSNLLIGAFCKIKECLHSPA
jgi:hypothetical protein